HAAQVVDAVHAIVPTPFGSVVRYYYAAGGLPMALPDAPPSATVGGRKIRGSWSPLSIPGPVVRLPRVPAPPHRKERAMKYLCLAYGDEERMKALTKAEFEALVGQCAVHDEELRRTGQVLSTESLEWATTTIRSRGGKVVVTDGPFVETKEKVGGLF